MPRYTDKQLGEALTDTRGMVYVAAKQLKCSPTTILKRLEKSAKLRAIKEAESELFLDTAELKLQQAVTNSEPWSIKYALSTKGKNRGYTERTEITGADGGPHVHKIVVVDPNSEAK